VNQERWSPAAVLVVSAMVLVLTGCATTPPRTPDTRSPIPGQTTTGAPEPSPTPGPSPVSPVPGTPVGTTASGGQITTTAPVPTLLDTLPSADAVEVLRTIPEPLPPEERVPPPAGASRRVAPAPASAPDSTDEDVEAAADIPVPSPTRALGDRPSPPDTTALAAASPAVTPASSPPPQTPAKPTTAPGQPASPDTCWRVQLAAVPESERAQALRAAGQSQLEVPVVVESEGKLFKVRTKDCMTAAAAEQLRRRADSFGFSGAFRFQRK
jgi:hypothetical protein